MPSGEKPKPTPAETSRKLREQALRVAAPDLGLSPTSARPDVWGVVMDLGFEGAVASLAVFAEGSASLYISTGGGVIGAGEHAPVRAAAEKLLDAAQSNLAGFRPAAESALPGPGRVHFHVRTFHGTLAAEGDEQDLGHGRHTLSPVFHAGHAVITEIRLESERREAR
jgi:hypothetical protein